MGTIADKLVYLDGTKTALRDAINAAGGNIGTSNTFRSYASGWLRDKSATLSLDFANQQYVAKDLTTKFPDRVGFSNIVTFTRASTGTYFDANGVLQVAAVNQPRFDHDPVTGEPLGILIEEQRTNLLLNSATLVSQSRTVTATAHTLSFYGTGSVTLSGAATGTLVGTGVDTRVSLTFTPSAGSLTLTVSGSCTKGQLEAGSFPTSYIPTEASQVTRAADVCSVNTFSPWYNVSEGSIVVDFISAPGFGQSPQYLAMLSNGAVNNSVIFSRSIAGTAQCISYVSGVEQPILDAGVINSAEVTRLSCSFSSAGRTLLLNGSAAVSGTQPGGLPSVDRLHIGNRFDAIRAVNGHVRSVRYFPRRLTDESLVQITTP